MKNLSLLVLLSVFFGVFSCASNKEELLYPNRGNACDTTNITFRARVAPVFSTNCLSCHGNSVASSSGGGVRLQDYADVKANLNKAYGSMAHLPGYLPMPKGMSGRIDSCSIKAVRIWKEAGAPNN
jgi:hypothetical protein